jgi:hypothetical protein
MDATEKLMFVLGGLVAIVFFSFLLAWPVMWLWNNALVGAISGFTEISWLQAWGIKILFGLLFKTTVTTKAS